MASPDGHPLELLVRKLETHYRLSAEDREHVLGLPYKLRWMEAQSYSVREGDRPERCAVLISGFAFRHKLTGDGSRQIMSLNIPGEALDFQNLFLTSPITMFKCSPADLSPKSRSAPIEQLVLEHPNVARAILIFTLVEASIFREWTLNVGQRDSRSRISHLLCEFAYRLTCWGWRRPATSNCR